MPEIQMTITGYRCARCQWEWRPRTERRPTICPHCKSLYWDGAPVTRRVLIEERDLYRQVIEGILDLPFAGAEVHNRYLHFVLEHRRLPTIEECGQVTAPSVIAGRPAGEGGRDG